MMGSYIMQMGCQIQCPHGGLATVIPSNTRVKVDTGFALLSSDIMTITGCPFTIGTTPSPCVTIQWVNDATQVKILGKPVLLDTSLGLCKNPAGVPQGNAIVNGVQRRVKGS